MKLLLCLTALAAVACVVLSKHSSPKVQLYSRNPGMFGMDNILICHVNNFHPPDITIELLEDGAELKNANQTDLAFKQDWQFHLTKSAPFKPSEEKKYTCRVTHSGEPKEYMWEPNM